jgi:hypothetical protein
MNINTIFEVRYWDGTTLKHSHGNEKRLLLVPQMGSLPLGPGELVILHLEHANHSRQMIWKEDPGAFTCQHCQFSVGVSKKLYSLLLSRLSAENYNAIVDDSTTETATVIIAHPPVEQFVASKELPEGYYVVAMPQVTDPIGPSIK